VRLAIAAAVAAVSLSLAPAASFVALAPPAEADPVPGPPYVDHVQWAKWADLSSLRVYPTAAARQASLQPGTDAQADEAWAEVLTLSPDADTPGMKAQFLCHWHFAEFAQPGKTSWNLEPWRNLVSDDAMVAAGCNPGGTEEPF
jgi:hypothetical protein